MRETFSGSGRTSWGIGKVVTDAIKRLVDWGGLAKFVQAFPDPVSALIGIAVVFVTVSITVVVVIALICSTVRAGIRAQRDIDLQLAKRGFVRPRTGSGAMWPFVLAVLLIAALGAIVVLATVIWSERAKADYERAVYFSERFADQAAMIMMNSALTWEVRSLVLAAAAQIGQPQYARRTEKLLRKIPERSPGELEEFVRDQTLLNAFREYLFAQSFFVHRRGERLRQLASSKNNIKIAEAAYLMSSQDSPEVEFWDWHLRSAGLQIGGVTLPTITPFGHTPIIFSGDR